MVQGRKISGGKYHKFRKTKKHSLSGIVRTIKVQETKKKTRRERGGTKRKVLLTTNEVNLMDPKTKKATKTKILNVVETPSNRFLARQNILVKSAIVETEKGKARITSRPGQEGSVHAVLVEE